MSIYENQPNITYLPSQPIPKKAKYTASSKGAGKGSKGIGFEYKLNETSFELNDAWFNDKIVNWTSTEERLSHCHKLATIEYGAKWEGMLTLRSTNHKHSGNFASDIRQWLALCRKTDIKFYYSTYFHRKTASDNNGGSFTDYHAHIFVRALTKKHPKTYSDDMIRKMRTCWHLTDGMNNCPPDDKWFHYERFTNYQSPKPNQYGRGGNYGYYGIKQGYHQLHDAELSDIGMEINYAAKRGTEFMITNGFTSYYWDYLDNSFSSKSKQVKNYLTDK